MKKKLSTERPKTKEQKKEDLRKKAIKHEYKVTAADVRRWGRLMTREMDYLDRHLKPDDPQKLGKRQRHEVAMHMAKKSYEESKAKLEGLTNLL